VKAFPNPFKPTIHQSVQIVNLPEDSLPAGNSECRIYDSSGALIATIKENIFSRFDWNGKSSGGKACKSGIYFFVVADDSGKVKRGKLALIN
jgi:flagellar hook assembly protein FlgD